MTGGQRLSLINREENPAAKTDNLMDRSKRDGFVLAGSLARGLEESSSGEEKRVHSP